MEQKQKQQPPAGGGPGGRRMRFEKPKNAKGTIKRLFGYLDKRKGLLGLVVLLVVISSGANIAGTYMLSPTIGVIEEMLTTGETSTAACSAIWR